jgi:hypothetical protein
MGSLIQVFVMEENRRESLTSSRKEIIDELLKCRDNACAIGIWSSSLGKGMFLCFVKEVVMDEDEEDVVVILNENDLHGLNFETHVLYLSEIEQIFRFRTQPNNTLKVSSSQRR